MSEGPLTAKQLRLLLENKYNCTYDGKDLAPPYESNDDMPDWYISPSGHFFMVSPAPDSVGYRPWMVEMIVTAGKLDVVVAMEKKAEKKAETSEE